MRGSLRLQLLAWVLVPLACLAAVNAATGHRNARQAADLVTDRTLIGSARAIAEATRSEEGQLQAVVPPAALEMFDTGEGDFVYYRIVDGSGRLIAGAPDLPLPPDGPEDVDSYEVDYRGRPMRLYALDHALAGPGPPGLFTVVVATSLGGRDAMVRRLWLGSLAQGLTLLGTAGVFMVFGLKRGLAPLLRLRDEVQARPSASLEPLAPEAVQGEVRPLVDAINGYIGRVKAQMAAKHRFVANAAHQFRTPLAVLSLQAAYAARRAGEEDQAVALQAIQVGVRQMSRLAEQLLTLSRAEPGGRRPRDDRVALGALARRVLDGFVASALDRDIDLGLDERDEAVVAGDETMLGEMLSNLVDNALRYCPRGSCVTVAVGLSDGVAVLEVGDDGPGVPPGEEERIFERFYRVSGTEAAGSGLGLSIVKEAVETAGGSVRATRPPRGGLVLAVRLPAVRSDDPPDPPQGGARPAATRPPRAARPPRAPCARRRPRTSADAPLLRDLMPPRRQAQGHGLRHFQVVLPRIGRRRERDEHGCAEQGRLARFVERRLKVREAPARVRVGPAPLGEVLQVASVMVATMTAPKKAMSLRTRCTASSGRAGLLAIETTREVAVEDLGDVDLRHVAIGARGRVGAGRLLDDVTGDRKPSTPNVISSTTVENNSSRAYWHRRCVPNTSSIQSGGNAYSNTVRAMTLAGACCSKRSRTAR